MIIYISYYINKKLKFYHLLINNINLIINYL